MFSRQICGFLIGFAFILCNESKTFLEGDGCNKFMYLNIDGSCPAQGLFARVGDCKSYEMCLFRDSDPTEASGNTLFCDKGKHFNGIRCVLYEEGINESTDCPQTNCAIVTRDDPTSTTEKPHASGALRFNRDFGGAIAVISFWIIQVRFCNA